LTKIFLLNPFIEGCWDSGNNSLHLKLSFVAGVSATPLRSRNYSGAGKVALCLCRLWVRNRRSV